MVFATLSISSGVWWPGNHPDRILGSQSRDCLYSCVQALLKQRLTSVGSKLTVKRKSQPAANGRRDRWWFIVRGGEDDLDRLQSKWEAVSIQTRWKIERVSYFTSTSDSSSLPTQGKVSAVSPLVTQVPSNSSTLTHVCSGEDNPRDLSPSSPSMPSVSLSPCS